MMLLEGNDRDASVVDEVTAYLAAPQPRSFFLFAGAGSGKTRTLVETLRRLTGVEAHDAGTQFAARLRSRGQSIRVITYTRNAISVINGRLGENDLTKVSTIHGFCWGLIGGFDDDIREALLGINAQNLEKAKETAAQRVRGPTPKDKRILEDLQEKAEAIKAIPRFIYHPDRNTYGEGALQHAQIIAITEWLLSERPTLRQILADRHPVILIDESQDTMKGMLGALMKVAEEKSTRLALGFLGDHRQRIYADGHQDLPGLIPEAWARPALQMNHRSQKRIVELINHIWETEMDGRTQPVVGVKQHSRIEKNAGTVRIFIGNTAQSADAKIAGEARCAQAMTEISGHREWGSPSKGFQILALEHRLAARRGGFLEVFNALLLIDPDSTAPQGSGENTGPAAVRVLLREVTALAACFDGRSDVDEFLVMEVLHRFDRLSRLSIDTDLQKEQLAKMNIAVKEFAELCAKTDATVRQILEPIISAGLFDIDDRLAKAFRDIEPPSEVSGRGVPESSEDRRLRGWHALFKARWSEVGRYKSYLEGNSNLSTHQVVKGSEFEHVLVVMDDQEAGGFLFSYDKIFGAEGLSETDENNVEQKRETSIDRTLRLLYVTCSRARESLALVLWSSNPELALAKIKTSGWFAESEINVVPDELSGVESSEIVERSDPTRLILYRSICEPDREGLSWKQVWEECDRGLINCWEIGRRLARRDPQLAEQCRAGVLPVLNWKGGASRTLKKMRKFGSLRYLAQWQGIRGDDLSVNLNAEISLTCTETGTVVTYTSDWSKLASQPSGQEEG
ncbi:MULTISPECIES: UvrD-helicase domain-containing protein [unclassified Pseudomonas]|jgi:DNA helicase-2/ATP-dependent DNA helicase PcrA|uniref:UvrD-helicase domain-containing protein n=1 Tax=unclassified Pseudomonas TaxID=196821 RepID=UPI0008E5CF4B|nr:DNA helicase-2 / ATP-dependent DNA helicase PcrA [Pseudomonas sp. NFPP04]SFK03973.1 DNA helicase-2 / ATP-dependent DNA helicase PcrA [Pseudomonas sp. NFPP11]